MAFAKKDLKKAEFSPYELIGDEWGLLTAGDKSSHNTMTISWGQTGVLWNKPVFTVFVRPTRYTTGFMDSSDKFTVSCFGKGYRKELGFCGSHSGKDVDKDAETGFTPIELEGAAAYEQAEKVFLCKKLYVQDMDKSGFTGSECLNFYEDEPMHRIYIGEITGYYVKEQ